MRPSRTALLTIALAAIVALVTGSPAAAQDKVPDDVKSLLESGKKRVAAELERILGARDEAIAKELSALIDRRVAKLEEALKERDKKIADLEAKLKDLAAAPKPAAPREPAPSPAFLGVGHADVPADVREKLKIQGGALVSRVIEGSPAAAAGVQAGDVIVSINGHDVTSSNLKDLVLGFQPGQEVNIIYFHDGTKATKSAKLADATKFDPAAGKPKDAPKKEPVKLGLEIEEKDGGLIVTDVEAGLTGSVAGLATGDKITQLNGKDVKTIDEIEAELKKVLGGEKLTVVFLRSSDKEDTTFVAKVIGAPGKEGTQLLGRESKKTPKPAEKKKGVLGIAVVLDPAGVLIQATEADSAAAAHGIQKGDVLKKLNGKDIAEVEDLKEALSKLSAGDKVTVHLARGGQTVEIKDIPLAADGEKVKAVAKADAPKDAPKDAVKDATKPAEPEKPAEKPKKKAFLRIYAMDDRATGQPVVTQVTAGGPGEKGGLKIGDVILKVDDKVIGSGDDLQAALASRFGGDMVTIRVKRGSEEMDLKVTLGSDGGDAAKS